MIGAVNPHTTITVQQPVGMTTTAEGRRVPVYETITNVPAQVQPLQHDELQLLEGLGLQGQKTALYLNGQWAGLVRGTGSPAPLFIIDGVTWMLLQTLEDWPDWTKAALVRQID